MDINNIDSKLLFRDIVILYCPKKVGSTTISSSIRVSASDKFAVFHTHNEILSNSLEAKNKDFCFSDVIRNNSIFNINTQQPRKVYIIDIYRTPVERKLSEFFQEISISHFYNTEENIKKYSFDKINKRFNDIFPYLGDTDYYGEKYNIDKPEEFDFEKKYIMYEKNGVIYIKLRLIDSKYWGEILSNLLNTEITIVNENNTDNKLIGDLYKEFKKLYKLPYNFFNMLENCKHLKYYYNHTERFEYLNYWYNRITGIHEPFKLDEYNFYKKINIENKYKDIDKLFHYRDYGCLCINCSNNRKKLLDDIKNGVENNNYIIHDINSDININTYLVVKLFYKDEDDNEIIQNMLLNV